MRYERNYRRREIKKDEYVYILDFRETQTKEKMFKLVQVAQSIGEQYFSLLEIAPRKGITFTVGEKVYIGEGRREKVDHIIRKISYDELTNISKNNLIDVVEKIVMNDEKRYIRFFNTAPALTPRLHSIETIPRLGKKLAGEIIREREIRPFESFKDMEKRIKNFGNGARHIAEKIIEELKGESKYNIFVEKEVQ